MSDLEVNTKKLGEIYKEWRCNESCYDNGRPVFEADELLDFAQFCLRHEANDVPTVERQSNIPDVSVSVCTCEMPAKVNGKNECWRCKRPFKEFL